MFLPSSAKTRRQQRPGKILVLFALMLPALLGLLGLVIDSGLLMAAHRQAQNAADAAAMAAAFDLLRGNSMSNAQTTAETFVKQHNGLSAAQVMPLSQPTSGEYTTSHYVEVVVKYPVKTLFIQALGVNPDQTVQARAVAGFEPHSAGEGVAVLNPTPSGNTGLSVSGTGTQLIVNGRIVVNAVDSSAAATVSNGALVKARQVDVVGGVNNVNNFQPYDVGDPNPVHTGSLMDPDSLINLPTPKEGDAGFSKEPGGSPSISNNNRNLGTHPLNRYDAANNKTYLYPGIYQSISISGGNVEFQPGIYVLKPPSSGGGANTLTITGGTVLGNGVMFYNTGSDYNSTSGSPDTNDGSATPSPPSGTKFGGIDIRTATIDFRPLSGGDFDGMLFYNRRWNSQTVKIAGSSGTLKLAGTLYNKWGKFDISGGGTFDAQFIAGSMSLSGGAALTVNYTGKKIGKANQVYLVE